MSLEASLQLALPLVDQLDYYIQRAKRLCNQRSEHGLTLDESAAVYLYSSEWNNASLHHALNKALESDDRTKLKPWSRFLHLFNRAMDKLPTVRATLWRGLPFTLVGELAAVEEIVCRGVTSCSLSEPIIASMLNNDFIRYSIESAHGKDVRGYTSHNGDEEILLLAGTRLRRQTGTLSNPIQFEDISEVNADPASSSEDIAVLSSCPSNGDEHIGKPLPGRIELGMLNLFSGDPSIQEPENASHFSVSASDRVISGPALTSERSGKSAIFSVVTFANGDQYEVAYENNERQGLGIFTTADGSTFEGAEADERANGQGICIFVNGDRYIGMFERGRRHGHGILYNDQGWIRVGQWTDDQLVEQALEIHSNTNDYEWRIGKDGEQWYGVIHDARGNKYIGGLNDGKANGLGVRIWNDNSRYEGNFKDDRKQGYGIYYYSDRDKYIGQWDDDEINGEGILTWTSGTCYKGTFRNGQRHGQGKVKLSNDQIREGHWENDELIT